jgi:hypothetical protein
VSVAVIVRVAVELVQERREDASPVVQAHVSV